MKKIKEEIVYHGPLADVAIEDYACEDGRIYQRQIIKHPGAVAIVAHDEDEIFMVRQPREAVGEDNLLELPAGTLDVPGEEPLACAQRELAEEVGLQAETWQHLKSIYPSPGYAQETVHIFEARVLSTANAHPDDDERIEIVRYPLEELAQLIDTVKDSKSLVGLLLLERRI